MNYTVFLITEVLLYYASTSDTKYSGLLGCYADRVTDYKHFREILYSSWRTKESLPLNVTIQTTRILNTNTV